MTEENIEVKTTRKLKDWEGALLIILAAFVGLWFFSIIGLLIGLVVSAVYVLNDRKKG